MKHLQYKHILLAFWYSPRIGLWWSILLLLECWLSVPSIESTSSELQRESFSWSDLDGLGVRELDKLSCNFTNEGCEPWWVMSSTDCLVPCRLLLWWWSSSWCSSDERLDSWSESEYISGNDNTVQYLKIIRPISQVRHHPKSNQLNNQSDYNQPHNRIHHQPKNQPANQQTRNQIPTNKWTRQQMNQATNEHGISQLTKQPTTQPTNH